MNIYAVYFKNANGVRYAGHCELCYEDGFLFSVVVRMEMSEAQRGWFFSNLPLTKDSLLLDFKTPKMQVTEVIQKIGFVDFWNAYAYKVGKKERAEKLWKQLNDEERTLCMKAIPKYNAFLWGRKIERKYPETFLSNRTWENEFV